MRLREVINLVRGSFTIYTLPTERLMPAGCTSITDTCYVPKPLAPIKILWYTNDIRRLYKVVIFARYANCYSSRKQESFIKKLLLPPRSLLKGSKKGLLFFCCCFLYYCFFRCRFFFAVAIEFPLDVYNISLNHTSCIKI